MYLSQRSWISEFVIFLLIARTNGYTCNDGCYISDSYVNDGFCDCSDCGDECGWTCATCSCPTTCGDYSSCSSDTEIACTTAPSYEYDYHYSPSSSYDSSDTQSFGCTTAGCSVEKTWLIDGGCVNPQLRVSIIETDYADSSTEYASVFVNDEYVDTCSELNQDCTYNWVQCINGDLIHQHQRSAKEKVRNFLFFGHFSISKKYIEKR